MSEKQPANPFDTAHLLDADQNVVKFWGSGYSQFRTVMAALSDTSVEKKALRDRVIVDTVKDGKEVVIFVPERAHPARSWPALRDIALLVKNVSEGKMKPYIIISGGVDGERQAYCGEFTATKMAEYFKGSDNEDLFNWTNRYCPDWSKHAGHQAIICAPLLMAANTALLIVLSPVEHFPRLPSKLAKGIRIFQNSWKFLSPEDIKKGGGEGSPVVNRLVDNLKVICVPVFPLDGLGWPGMTDRGVSAWDDSFAPECEAPLAAAGGIHDHKICGENTTKLKKELNDSGMVNPCPNMGLAEMLEDPMFSVEFGVEALALIPPMASVDPEPVL